MDGIDVAVLKTDGVSHVEYGHCESIPYDPAFREQLRSIMGMTEMTPEVQAVSRDLTRKHLEAIAHLLKRWKMTPAEFDVIGFHGHTIAHIPEKKISLQIGDGSLIANVTGIPVVDNFRKVDVAAGGQGAPLASLFHSALAHRSAGVLKPAAVLNLGGVANVTWIGEPPKGDDDIGIGSGKIDIEGNLIAFDTGPGNALLDDWAMKTIEKPMDEGGKLAMAGTVNQGVLEALLSHPFFKEKPPKSLDRNAFSLEPLEGLSPEDGAATLAAFTVRSVALAEAFFPKPPRTWIITGGGRHNGILVKGLSAALTGTVRPAEAAGWNGDALEAQAFAYLAVRSLYGMSLSVPGTTGVKRALTGGTLHRKKQAEDD